MDRGSFGRIERDLAGPGELSEGGPLQDHGEDPQPRLGQAGTLSSAFPLDIFVFQ